MFVASRSYYCLIHDIENEPLIKMTIKTGMRRRRNIYIILSGSAGVQWG